MRSVETKNRYAFMTDSDYAELLKAWEVEFSALEPDSVINGSPERTACRTVVRDRSGTCWILEQIDEENLDRKREIAEVLERLASQVERVHVWRRTDGNLFFQTLENRRWMLRPYIEGIPLNRESWLADEWRMNAMGDFLLQMRECSGLSTGECFSIAEYAEGRMEAWSRRFPALSRALNPVFDRLQETFFVLHDSLPAAFCHGDFHPLNMVWGERDICSVIDWEFCGMKPELYDVALLLGCVGFDNPDNLIGKPAVRFISRLRSAGFGAPQSWNLLIGLVAAIRFGWMSEWVRRQDEESVEMEAVYLGILTDQAGCISDVWKSG